MASPYGFHQTPINLNTGISRVSTDNGHLRCWFFSRDKAKAALTSLRQEFQNIGYPSFYVLIDDKKHAVYVGEAKDGVDRLDQHLRTPPDKLEKWTRAFLFNDGRAEAQSLISDNSVRHEIELTLGRLFKTNKLKLVSQATKHSLGGQQKHTALTLFYEAEAILKHLQLVQQSLVDDHIAEVGKDEAQKALSGLGHTIGKFGAKEAEIDNTITYIRPGSLKPKGWQITIRGHFFEDYKKANGQLLINRGRMLLVPLLVIRDELVKVTNYAGRDTVDIFIEFRNDPSTALAKFKNNTLDLTRYFVQ